MTEHSSHMPWRALGTTGCCFEYVGAKCSQRTLQKPLLLHKHIRKLFSRSSPQAKLKRANSSLTSLKINNQTLNSAKQLFWSFLFVWIYMPWQVYNSEHSSPTTTQHQRSTTNFLTQPHHVQKVLTASPSQSPSRTTNEKIFPMDQQLHGSPKKKQGFPSNLPTNLFHRWVAPTLRLKRRWPAALASSNNE